ncbi:TPA: D-sedoheptulose 7-phosphate isomerase [Candidatus Poribacteria bacterium]|nr:D-sedoheptulose 7-phosphate isomerase [Candidatus Poribacteria bacterium]HEX29597.1 D-sedoheptulose 7-phosphate isomerase [Candidatus Poribacteria bacterium]
MKREIGEQIRESIEVKRRIVERMVDQIAEAADMLVQSLRKGGKVILFGNGGSAADAQHIAAELVGRFKMERRALPAIALNTNSSVITAIGNDYDFTLSFSRQVEALVKEGDVAVGISTSGNSSNVIYALKRASELGAKTIALTGKTGGMLASVADLAIIVPSDDTPRIQEAHITIGHVLCDLVEKMLFGGE